MFAVRFKWQSAVDSEHVDSMWFSWMNRETLDQIARRPMGKKAQKQANHQLAWSASCSTKIPEISLKRFYEAGVSWQFAVAARALAEMGIIVRHIAAWCYTLWWYSSLPNLEWPATVFLQLMYQQPVWAGSSRKLLFRGEIGRNSTYGLNSVEH